MVLGLELEKSLSQSQLKACKRALDEFESCGRAFYVVSIWLHALAQRSDFKRCPLCYRYVDPDLRKYCAVHWAKPSKRMPESERYLADSFHATFNDLLESKPELFAIDIDFHIGSDDKKVILNDLRLDDLVVEAAKAEFKVKSSLKRDINQSDAAYDDSISDLVRPAIIVAIALRAMYPAFAPELAHQFHAHFSSFVHSSKLPFLENGSYNDAEARRQANASRALSVRRFNVQRFLGTFFMLPCPDGKIGTVGSAIDPGHPTANGQSISLRDVTLDLARLRCWLWNKETFFEYAYLDGQHMALIRSTVNGLNGRPKSFKEIGKEFGVSGEAVRKALAPQRISKRSRRIKADVRSTLSAKLDLLK